MQLSRLEGLRCSPIGKVLPWQVGSLVAHVCNFSIQNAEAGGSEIQGYPGPHNEFKTILNYRERLHVLKSKTEKKFKLILKMLLRGHK